MQDVAEYREIENSEVVNIQDLNNEQLYHLLNIQDNNIQNNIQNNIEYNNIQDKIILSPTIIKSF